MKGGLYSSKEAAHLVAFGELADSTFPYVFKPIFSQNVLPHVAAKSINNDFSKKRRARPSRRPYNMIKKDMYFYACTRTSHFIDCSSSSCGSLAEKRHLDSLCLQYPDRRRSL